MPILEPKLKARVIREGLRAYLADNSNAWEMNADGEYHRKKGRMHRSAQEQLLASLAAS